MSPFSTISVLLVLLFYVEKSSQIKHFLDLFATDLYQLTMAGAYLDENIGGETAIFDLFFREAPFDNDYAVFAGLNEVCEFLANFRIREESLRYLLENEEVKTNFSNRNMDKLIAYLAGMGKFNSEILDDTDNLKSTLIANDAFVKQGAQDFDNLQIFAVEEGTIVFPHTPIIRVEGPIIVGQILETLLLNVVNFATLVASNGLRYRITADGLSVINSDLSVRNNIWEWGKTYNKFDEVKIPKGYTADQVVLSKDSFNTIRHEERKSARLAWEEIVWEQIVLKSGSKLLKDDFKNRIKVLEFGMRRAQGPDGALTASQYSYMGMLDGTSNVLAGEMFKIPIKGTHAHSFVCTHDNNWNKLMENHPGFPYDEGTRATERKQNFIAQCKELQEKIFKHFQGKWGNLLRNLPDSEIDSELLAFTAYALSYPQNFTALIDTYNTYNGLVNFLAVGVTLSCYEYQPKGIRIDSGDLRVLSDVARIAFKSVQDIDAIKSSPHRKNIISNLDALFITVSNDINYDKLLNLSFFKNEFNVLGIGTNLATCADNPALGGVYKLAKIGETPKRKISNDIAKATLPDRKSLYRILFKTDEKLRIFADVLIHDEDQLEKKGEIFCPKTCGENGYEKVKIPDDAELLPLHDSISWKNWDGRQGTVWKTIMSNSRDRVEKTLENLHVKAHDRKKFHRVCLSKNLYNMVK